MPEKYVFSQNGAPGTVMNQKRFFHDQDQGDAQPDLQFPKVETGVHSGMTENTDTELKNSCFDTFFRSPTPNECIASCVFSEPLILDFACDSSFRSTPQRDENRLHDSRKSVKILLSCDRDSVEKNHSTLDSIASTRPVRLQ